MHLKTFTLIALLFSVIQIKAQSGCESSLSTSMIPGPDSLYTDADQTFRSLTINPYNENHIMVGTEGNGMFSSRDGGTTWQWHRSGLRHNSPDEYAETWNIWFDPSDTNVIYSAATNSPGPLTGNYPSAMAGVYKSTDGGKTWAQKNCGLPSTKIASMWMDSSIIVISVSGEEPSFTNPPKSFYAGGLYYSTDKGDNWVKSSVNVNMDSVQCWRILKRGNTLYTLGFGHDAGRCTGFVKSTDKGKTWQTLPQPLAKRTIGEYGISQDGQRIVALVRDSFFIYISENAGTSWTKMNFMMNGHLSIHPYAKDTMFFAGWTDLHKTTKGFSNADINSSDYLLVKNFPFFIEKIEFAPTNPQIVYLTTRDYRVYKSTDGGDSFTLMVRLRDVMRIIGTPNDTEIEEPHSSFSVYPNPSEGIFNLPSEVQSIIVSDMITGKIVYKDDHFENKKSLDLSALANGIYVLMVNENYAEKIVISK